MLKFDFDFDFEKFFKVNGLFNTKLFALKFINKNQNLFNYLKSYFNDIPENLFSYREVIWRIKNDISKRPVCPICGKALNFIGEKKLDKEGKTLNGYRKHCSKECRDKDLNVLEKRKKTNFQKYKVDNIFKDPNIHKLGVQKSKSTLSKIKKNKTNIEKYGGISPANSIEIKNKIKETNLKKYNVETVLQLPENRSKAKSLKSLNKRKETYLKKYGVITPLLNLEIKKKRLKTLKEHNTFNSSKIEIVIQNLLDSLKIKYISEYFSDEYPYCCDFYLPDLKIYLEIQGSWVHGDHPYSENLKEDLDRKKLLEELSKKNFSEYYKNAINIWTVTDVNKRNIAKKNNLKYAELFISRSTDNEKIKDILKSCLEYLKNNKHYVYLENNFKLKYTNKELQDEFNYFKNNEGSLNTCLNKNKIIKQFQQDIFYFYEKQLLMNEDFFNKLIENRKKYLHKDIFTLDELIRGIKISNLYIGYSHFSPMWVKWFIETYNIKKLYDPCGGWGHHLLGTLNIEKYYYNDFDLNVCNNIKNILFYFNIKNVEVTNKDAKTYYPDDNIDGWFICPPYFNIETYNNKTFKDVNDYQDFLNKIFDNWKKSSAKILGLIIREDLVKYINYEYIKKVKINGNRDYN